MPGVLTGRANHAGLLLSADGPVRRAEVLRFPGLYLDKHQPVPFPADQIHFARTRRHAVIAIHDHDAGALQEALGDVLTAAAQGMLGGQVVTAGVVAEEVGEGVRAGACKRKIGIAHG